MATAKIEIGTSWTGPNGRTWAVYELLPGGRARVRSGMRFGEMNYRSIRLSMELARMGYSCFAAPAEEPIAYLRDLDGTGSYHACAQGDPGSFAVFAPQVPA